jgi:hypothetical protein
MSLRHGICQWLAAGAGHQQQTAASSLPWEPQGGFSAVWFLLRNTLTPNKKRTTLTGYLKVLVLDNRTAYHGYFDFLRLETGFEQLSGGGALS